MALSTKQLCLINNLLYSKSPSFYGNNAQTSYQGRTIGDMIDAMSASGNATGTASADEWKTMIEEIRNDPQLMNMQIRDTYYDHSNGDGGCLLVDPSSNEAVVAFKGTGKGEWKDNFIAGTTMENSGSDPTISVQQQKAIDYTRSLDLSQYDTVTVTGHSKGGNKAKICALMNDEIDRCVSFDGQGFSDEFFDAHSAEIRKNQGKIENHNVDSDFVNILLNDIGETTYYQGQHVGENFPKNHDPSSFFNSDGEMIVGTQSEDMKALDAFLNSALRSMDPKQKAEMLETFGEVAHVLLGNAEGDRMENLKQILFDPRYKESVTYLMAYIIKYEKETGKITDVVQHILDQMGVSEAGQYIDIVNKIMNNDFLYGIVINALKLGQYVPDWVLDLIRNFVDIPFSNEELQYMLGIISRTAELSEDIEIDPYSGQDRRVATTSWIDRILKNIFKKISWDGSSDWSGPGTINYSSDEVQQVIQGLRLVQDAVNTAQRALRNVDLSSGGCEDLRVHLSMKLSHGQVSGSDVRSALLGIQTALRALGVVAQNLASAVSRTDQSFSLAERMIASAMGA